MYFVGVRLVKPEAVSERDEPSAMDSFDPHYMSQDKDIPCKARRKSTNTGEDQMTVGTASISADVELPGIREI